MDPMTKILNILEGLGKIETIDFAPMKVQSESHFRKADDGGEDGDEDGGEDGEDETKVCIICKDCSSVVYCKPHTSYDDYLVLRTKYSPMGKIMKEVKDKIAIRMGFLDAIIETYHTTRNEAMTSVKDMDKMIAAEKVAIEEHI